jgi:hypothetical protein
VTPSWPSTRGGVCEACAKWERHGVTTGPSAAGRDFEPPFGLPFEGSIFYLLEFSLAVPGLETLSLSYRSGKRRIMAMTCR